MRKITADWLFPISSAPVREGVLILDEAQRVVAIEDRAAHDPASLDHQHGVLVPGFVNTHCHLELSHMKGKVATGTGLIPFIQRVVTQREVAQEEIDAAIVAADREMYEAGIVAVGDISNQTDTFAQKDRSSIRYYTFVEMFDFLQDASAAAEFEKYRSVYEAHSDHPKNRRTAVPHAPYSVSPQLFARIDQLNGPAPQTISIHNQETPPENELFLQKSGGFIDFYQGFGISLEDFTATGQTAIHYALAHLNPQQRTLFVHNTLSTSADIQAAQAWGREVYWATCPNANLYIENRLPNYRAFLERDAKMTIGTDSLTSNWQLSVLEELKTIARYQSYVPFETLLRWATLNGAEALGFADELGSFEVGKQPGVNLLTVGADWQLSEGTEVLRLV
ncbi:MAG: amidohydrolase family protein [Bacteroidota bacterium]